MAFWVRAKKPRPLKPTANPYPSRFQRWRQSLVLKFSFIFALGIALRFYTPAYNFIQQQLFEVAALAQGILVYPFGQANLVLGDMFTFLSLKEDYDRLKQENDSLKWQLQTLTPLQHENIVLKAKLNIKDFEKYRHIASRVLATPYDGIHYFLVILAGQKEKLEEGQAVVVPEGVVGRLEKIGEYVSRVLLLNDVESRIPVMTVKSGQKAILAGDESSLPILVYITDIRKVEKGERVVTSGLGGIFPPGIPVGVVDQISNGKIIIRPYVNFRDLEWVTVLKANAEGYIEDLKTSLEGE